MHEYQVLTASKESILIHIHLCESQPLHHIWTWACSLVPDIKTGINPWGFASQGHQGTPSCFKTPPGDLATKHQRLSMMVASSLSSQEGNRTSTQDVEKQAETTSSDRKPHSGGLVSLLRISDGEVYEASPEKHSKWYQRFLDAGAEENGIKPVPLFQRTNRQYSNLFTMFFTCLLCLLP